MITQEKRVALSQRMVVLGIREEDLDEQFVRGSGKGGQKINKTSSCVQLLHRPSGIEVKCQATRLQAVNRFFARRLLCDRIEERIRGAQSRKKMEQEKVRRQKRRRSRRARQRMLEEKRHQSAKKEMRRPVRPDSG